MLIAMTSKFAMSMLTTKPHGIFMRVTYDRPDRDQPPSTPTVEGSRHPFLAKMLWKSMSQARAAPAEVAAAAPAALPKSKLVGAPALSMKLFLLKK
jgi:hypothetical protein